MIPLHDLGSGVSFAVKVRPRAKKNAITGKLGDALKVSLTAPPVEGRANEGCIEFFAKLLKVPRASVSIASGETTRSKVVRVVGMPAEELRRRQLYCSLLADLGRLVRLSQGRPPFGGRRFLTHCLSLKSAFNFSCVPLPPYKKL